MSSIGELFGFDGQQDQNQTPFDPATLDSQLDAILATRPVAGAPEGYVSPPRPPAPASDGDQGAVGGGQVPPAAPAPEQPPAAPPRFGWPPGPTTPYPPAPPAAPAAPAAPSPPPVAGAPAPVSFWDQLNPLQQQELMLTHQALQDPERQGAVRRAYIGGNEPRVAAVDPTLAPPPAAPPPPTPPQLPEGLEEGTPEAAIFYRQAETERQLSEIREQVTRQNVQSERDADLAAATSAIQKFAGRYGDRLTNEDLTWIAQSAGFAKLPEAFRASQPALSREEAMDRALEFQLRSTDSLLAKIISPVAPAPQPPGAPPPLPPGTPVVYPGQTPQADARHRYLTALSSAASPSGDVPQRQALQHRPDGKLDEKSRMQLVQEMTSGGTLGELMGPG